ncbi:uncharacterized protein RAG0_17442 [Rhynchosporium agropyri]|uniref:Uncharacterized protein n=1 Tax=Rhynchosporium agropyri TaxID=914238 RepID=A0A1E1LTS9_9HELO|nr:uncharacterized protein RAG0_17442 [Rhynchosporium agropyri]
MSGSWFGNHRNIYIKPNTNDSIIESSKSKDVANSTQLSRTLNYPVETQRAEY